jgi:hypothetical protein
MHYSRGRLGQQVSGETPASLVSKILISNFNIYANTGMTYGWPLAVLNENYSVPSKTSIRAKHNEIVILSGFLVLQRGTR